MKVLLLGVQLTSLVNFRAPLIRDLIAAGVEVVVVAPEPREPWLSRLEALGCRYIKAPLSRSGINPLADIKTFLWLWHCLRHEKPDTVFTFQAKAVIYGIPAACFAGIRHRVAMVEGLGQGFSSGEGVRRRLIGFLVPLLYRVSLALAHTVIFLNDEDQREFLDRRILHKQRSVVIPGIGIDLRYFSCEPVPSSPPVFLMMARLLVDKGVREFAAAAVLVKNKFPDARFQLLGAADPTPAGVPSDEVMTYKSVEYLGVTDDVRPFLARSHVVVLPTFYREGMPRSLLEGLATGRPIITTDIPGARETVIDKLNGYLVKPRDPNALATAMFRLMENPAALGEMGKASRRLAEERFDVVRINQTIMAELGVKQ